MRHGRDGPANITDMASVRSASNLAVAGNRPSATGSRIQHNLRLRRVWFKREAPPTSRPIVARISNQAQCSRNSAIHRGVGLFVFLLAVVGTAFAVGHARRRTLLLGWVLFLNMPMFCKVVACERRADSTYAAAGVDDALWSLRFRCSATGGRCTRQGHATSMARRRRESLRCFGRLLSLGAPRVGDWMLRHDAVHCRAPFLDPQGFEPRVCPSAVERFRLTSWALPARLVTGSDPGSIGSGSGVVAASGIRTRRCHVRGIDSNERGAVFFWTAG